MSKSFRGDRVFWIFLVGAMIFWALAAVGAVRAYSPVPFWDMWDGYIGFFLKVSSGDWSAWWAQHNEHRIALARVLFWIDLSWFDGTGWFLLIANYFLLAAVCFVFWIALIENCPKHYHFIGLFLTIWLSSWSHQENLTWGFQCQLILAQLLPLSGFFMLHKAVSTTDSSNSSFVAACFVGILSLGTMANGVLALPLMTAYALITRLGWRQVAILVVLSGLGLAVYFYNYHAPSGHGSLLVALTEHPAGLVRYVLLYLGGPFFHILKGGGKALIVAQVAGGFLVACAVYFSWWSLRKIGQSSLELALLTYILYVGGTALGTAGGRLMFGAEQSLSSRYMTPALMAWAALIVIFAPRVIRFVEPHRWKLWIPMLGLVLAMLPLQLTALKPHTTELFERSVAALALEMRIKDQAQIERVFPHADVALSLSEAASEQNISIFGQPLFKNVREQIGQLFVESASTARVCVGSVDGIESIEDSRYFRVRGWFFDQKRKSVPNLLWIVGDKGAFVGYVLLGQARPDVTAAIDSAAVNAGFKGYLLAEAQGLPAKLFDPQSKCILPVTLPVSYFRILKFREPKQVSVASERILQGNQWTGTDSWQSRLDGLAVYGSFIQSDADTGAISLRLQRGDSLLYRSGPTGGRQFVWLNNEDSSKSALSVSLEWQILDFSSPILPDQFLVTLTDEGAGWGEWSAIAVRKVEVKK